MGISKNSVPKEFTSRFSTTGIKDKSRPFLMDSKKQAPAQTPYSFKDNFFINDLPPIPDPSEELKSLLRSYQEKCDMEVGPFIPKSRKKRPKTGKTRRKINGFMAFRSFYASSIPNTDYQRQLSTKLAEFWAKDKNQLVWQRFAMEYNFVERDDLFVDWLLQALHYNQDSEISRSKVQTKHSHTFKSGMNDVVDVFMYASASPARQRITPISPTMLPSSNTYIFQKDPSIIDIEMQKSLVEKKR